MNKLKITYYFLTLLTFLICLTAYGQNGMIRGQVYDRRENKGLEYAIIGLVDTKTGTVSDENGNFKIDNIPPGIYSLKVTYLGYGDTTITGINISPDSEKIFFIQLPPYCNYEKSINNNTCPKCKKNDKVIPIVYGLTLGPLDKKNYYYSGCGITFCDPNWFCKRNKIKF